MGTTTWRTTKIGVLKIEMLMALERKDKHPYPSKGSVLAPAWGQIDIILVVVRWITKVDVLPDFQFSNKTLICEFVGRQ